MCGWRTWQDVFRLSQTMAWAKVAGSGGGSTGMTERVPLGTARLYSISAAVTCPYCGLPMFLERPRVPAGPVDNSILCPECKRTSRLSVVVLEKELS